jgi:ABC-2 type transport system permease protein
LSYVTPHAWALDAYQELLVPPGPDLPPSADARVILQSCGALVLFGFAFLIPAWLLVRLE